MLSRRASAAVITSVREAGRSFEISCKKKRLGLFFGSPVKASMPRDGKGGGLDS